MNSFAQHASMVYVPFTRLEERAEGTGIGLPICRKLVERHGGRIWVESDGANGARFLFRPPDSRPQSRRAA